MKILITGDSHLSAIDRALKADATMASGYDVSIRPLGNAEVTHSPYFIERDNCLEITPQRLQLHLTSIPPNGEKPDVIAVSMLFHTLRMLRQARLWSSYAPASLGRNDLHCITRATFKRMVLNQQKYNLELMQKLKLFTKKVVALEGPRVFAHHTAFERTDPSILLEVDRQYRETMRAELDKGDIPVVDCPDKTFDKDTGLMKPEYKTKRAEDLHHANNDVGELILRDLIKLVER